ncbi:hypothetical protein CUM97_11185 [Enterococcus mundtii]|nr:hypothetical protein CUM97_11185 [Enterococcus mundtii]
MASYPTKQKRVGQKCLFSRNKMKSTKIQRVIFVDFTLFLTIITYGSAVYLGLRSKTKINFTFSPATLFCFQQYPSA